MIKKLVAVMLVIYLVGALVIFITGRVLNDSETEAQALSVLFV